MRLIVDADGACSGNGLPGARAGIGLVFRKPTEPGKTYFLAERLPGGAQTNQRAEMYAVIRGIEEAVKMRTSAMPWTELLIRTDSQYVYDWMTKYVAEWTVVNGKWIKSDGREAENQDLLWRLKGLLDDRAKLGVKYVVEKAEAHANDEYNNLADEYARKAVRGDYG